MGNQLEKRRENEMDNDIYTPKSLNPGLKDQGLGRQLRSWERKPHYSSYHFLFHSPNIIPYITL